MQVLYILNLFEIYNCSCIQPRKRQRPKDQYENMCDDFGVSQPKLMRTDLHLKSKSSNPTVSRRRNGEQWYKRQSDNPQTNDSTRSNSSSQKQSFLRPRDPRKRINTARGQKQPTFYDFDDRSVYSSNESSPNSVKNKNTESRNFTDFMISQINKTDYSRNRTNISIKEQKKPELLIKLFLSYKIFDDIKVYDVEMPIREEEKMEFIESKRSQKIVNYLNYGWEYRDIMIRKTRNKILTTYAKLGDRFIEYIDFIKKEEDGWRNIGKEYDSMFAESKQENIQVFECEEYSEYRFFRKEAYKDEILTIKNGSKIEKLSWKGDNIIIMGDVTIESKVKIHGNTYIGPNCIISTGSFIGKDCFLEKNVTLGCFVKLYSGNFILAGTSIGKVFDNGDIEKLQKNRHMKLLDFYSHHSPGISVFIGKGNIFGEECRVDTGSFFYLNNVIADKISFGKNVKVLWKNSVLGSKYRKNNQISPSNNQTHISDGSILGIGNYLVKYPQKNPLNVSFHRLLLLRRDSTPKTFFFGNYFSLTFYLGNDLQNGKLLKVYGNSKLFDQEKQQNISYDLQNVLEMCNDLALKDIYEINSWYEKI